MNPKWIKNYPQESENLGKSAEKRRKRDRAATPEDVEKILDDVRTHFGIKSELFGKKKQQSNLLLKQENDSDAIQVAWVKQQQLQKQSQDMLKQQSELAEKQQEQWRRQQEQRRRRQ
jgi:hypothetical protein